MLRTFTLAFASVTVLALAASCSSSSSNAPPANGDAGATDSALTSVAAGSFDLEIACSDSIDSVYGDPGTLPADKGAIIKCAKDADLSVADLTTGAKGYTGKALTSGAHVYRVLYRTERGDTANSPGYSSAIVYVPTVPRPEAKAGNLLPVIVSSHGTRGEAPACAPSRTARDSYTNYPLVGGGYVVIAPDLAGYANYGAANNPPSGYAMVSDVGKSTLDGARALRKMFPSSVSDKVILLGHSQGGGTTLGGLALNESYQSGGTLVGVVAYSPLWLSQASWGALPVEASSYPFVGNELINSVAIWYMYSHGELLDGAGHGVDAFKAEKRDAIKSFVDSACLDPNLDALHALGTNITDVYDPSLVSSLATNAAIGAACSDALCGKWKDRFNADRPHFTGATAQIPLLVPYGGADTTIAPGRMACVLERLDADKSNYKVCFDPTADHEGVVGTRSDYVNDWIAARALGAAEPDAAPCATPFQKPACTVPPPNEWP